MFRFVSLCVAGPKALELTESKKKTTTKASDTLNTNPRSGKNLTHERLGLALKSVLLLGDTPGPWTPLYFFTTPCNNPIPHLLHTYKQTDHWYAWLVTQVSMWRSNMADVDESKRHCSSDSFDFPFKFFFCLEFWCFFFFLLCERILWCFRAFLQEERVTLPLTHFSFFLRCSYPICVCARVSLAGGLTSSLVNTLGGVNPPTPVNYLILSRPFECNRVVGSVHYLCNFPRKPGLSLIFPFS